MEVSFRSVRREGHPVLKVSFFLAFICGMLSCKQRTESQVKDLKALYKKHDFSKLNKISGYFYINYTGQRVLHFEILLSKARIAEWSIKKEGEDVIQGQDFQLDWDKLKAIQEGPSEQRAKLILKTSEDKEKTKTFKENDFDEQPAPVERADQLEIIPENLELDVVHKDNVGDFFQIPLFTILLGERLQDLICGFSKEKKTAACLYQYLVEEESEDEPAVGYNISGSPATYFGYTTNEYTDSGKHPIQVE